MYIKNPETNALAAELAQALGTTKTQAVHDALLARKQTLRPRPADDLLARLDTWRAANPLPEPTGVKADKAFFDEMWGEDVD